MNLKHPANETHELVIQYRNAHNAARRALAARDAIEVCGSPEWLAAHKAAGHLFTFAHLCEQAVYDARLAFAPYWHVTPKQMEHYSRIEKGDL